MLMQASKKDNSIFIPDEVKMIAEKLIAGGFKAYLVGGCVRDLVLSQVEGLPRIPKDWDITTNAKPEQILKIFPDSVYENVFGTVAVKATRETTPTITRTNSSSTTKLATGHSAESGQRESASSQRESAMIVEVTTFRLDGKYTDKRHPDEVRFAKTIEEDLARRDFTVNALALDLSTKHEARPARPKPGEGGNSKQILNSKSQKVSDFGFRISDFPIVDLFNGQSDLNDGVIRCVGNPDQRFEEDALRLLRAVRFAAQLGFTIEEKTAAAVKRHAGLLEFIAKERIADEFNKIIMTERAPEAIEQMENLGLLKYVMPELREGIGVEQNKHHKYTTFEHYLKSLDYAVKKNFPLELRLASLLHDVGKPRSRQWRDDDRGEKTKDGRRGDWTFYQHQYIGERMVLEILGRLKYPRQIIEKIALLVREHMFVYDPEIVTPRGVRRMLSRVGVENVEDLLLLREADRIGSGVPKAQPYRLRSLKAAIEKVKKDPIHPKMLAVNGEDVMKILTIPPGPKVGQILAILLDGILDEPKLNEREMLLAEIKKMGALSEKELTRLAGESKKKAVEIQKRIDDEIDRKYFI